MSVVTEAHRQQYKEQGYFIVEHAISKAHLDLLRDTAGAAVGSITAEMDEKGVDTLGINHRGKRYFVGQSYAKHNELGDFLFSGLMADVCNATLGGASYLHNDQYVIKCGETEMTFSWHQDGVSV